MRSERVRYVFAVIEAGSLRGAASKLGLAGSTVSEGVRALETELGTTLFIRNHGMQLTSTGQSLLPHLRRLLRAEDALRLAVSDGENQPPIVLGTHLGYGSNLAVELNLVPPEADGVGIPVHYLAGDWRDFTNGLMDGRSDLAVIIGPLRSDAYLASEVICNEPVVAAVSGNLHDGSSASISLAALDDLGWAPVQPGLLDQVWLDRMTGVGSRGGPPPWNDTPPSTTPFELAAAVHAAHGVITAIRPFTDFLNNRGDHVLEVADIPPIDIRLAWRRAEVNRRRDAVIDAVLERGLTPTLGE